MINVYSLLSQVRYDIKTMIDNHKGLVDYPYIADIEVFVHDDMSIPAPIGLYMAIWKCAEKTEEGFLEITVRLTLVNRIIDRAEESMQDSLRAGVLFDLLSGFLPSNVLDCYNPSMECGYVTLTYKGQAKVERHTEFDINYRATASKTWRK